MLTYSSPPVVLQVLEAIMPCTTRTCPGWSYSPGAPGEATGPWTPFSTIVLDQFVRLRDGDSTLV